MASPVRQLVEGGVRMLEPVCGPCVGMGQAPPSGANSLRTFNRNFPGRSGTPEDSVFLCSPAVAAVSLLSGRIEDPREYGDAPELLPMPKLRPYVDDVHIFAPADATTATVDAPGLDRDATADLAASITRPLLAIHGDCDAVTSDSKSRELARLTGGAARLLYGPDYRCVSEEVAKRRLPFKVRRDLDPLDLGGVQRECSLHTDPEGLLADGEGLPHAVALTLDHNTLEHLRATPGALDHLKVHAQPVTGVKRRDASELRALQAVDHGAHGKCKRRRRPGDRWWGTHAPRARRRGRPMVANRLPPATCSAPAAIP